MNEDYISFNVILSKEDIISELNNNYSEEEIEDMNLEEEGKIILESTLQNHFSSFFVTNEQ